MASTMPAMLSIPMTCPRADSRTQAATTFDTSSVSARQSSCFDHLTVHPVTRVFVRRPRIFTQVANGILIGRIREWNSYVVMA